MWGRTIGWWYWLAIVVPLGAWLAGYRWALAAVVAVCVVQVIHFRILEGSANAFPVQVRLAFLGMLLAGLWEPLRALHWVQLVGTTAFLLFGYCLLARLLSLLSWNRSEPCSVALVRRTLFSRPQCGNVLQGLPREASGCRREVDALGATARQ